MGSNASLLSILKLNKRFGTHRALHAIDFQVSHGEIVLLLGSNGSGKSTLLKLCAGLLRPSAGRIDVRDTSIGYAGHEAMLYGELTVEENLEFFGALTNHSQNIAPALRTWNLEVHRKKRISELSQGLRHRASLARMMLSQPKTLLLDEPTNALDAEAVDTLSALVHGASKSGAAVIATHDIEQLRPIATRAVLLADGAIASDSASSENSENIDSVIFSLSQKESLMKQFCALLKKDFLLEARHLEAFITLLFLSILLSVVIAFGVNNAFLEQAVIAKIVPALFWTVFILTATVAIGKTGEYDERMRAVDGVLLTGVSLPTVFLAKMLTNFVLVLCAQAVTLGAFALLFGLDIGEIVLPLMMVVGLVVFAYVNLVTLLSAIAASARLKTLLLPLIGLPLLLPLFFSAVELSSDLFYRRELVWSSEWMSLLVILDVVYFAAGINMYEKVVRE